VQCGKDVLVDIIKPGTIWNRNGSLTINPLEERGWDALLATHSGSSFFHSSAWARVLNETYGHRPFYFCKIVDGRLEGLLPIMEVSSRLTGTRGISLPFTDFCSPLSVKQEPWNPYPLAILHGESRGWRYLECRSRNGQWPGASASLSFYGHLIHLDHGSERLFKELKGPVRTGIRKAQASKLRIEFGTDLEAMTGFYSLHCLSRRRHGLPPQPFRFFENIVRHVLAKGQGVVVSAFSGAKRIAAAVFFHNRREAVFKFGASDYLFQRLRPNNVVMWEAIKHYAANGLTLLHLGRTSLANPGLRRFKLGFGGDEELIEYYKYNLRKRSFVYDFDYSEWPASRVFRWLTLPALKMSGRLLYPHLG
jgi:hypothetical protein